jgi:hypothetical protein
VEENEPNKLFWVFAIWPPFNYGIVVRESYQMPLGVGYIAKVPLVVD